MAIAYGAGTYFDHTGDVGTMRATIAAFSSYLLAWSLRDGLVVPRTCPGEPHAADIRCAGLWDWCDGESVNCDDGPIDNAWYYWAVNTTARLARSVNATRPGGELTPSDLAELDRRIAQLRVAYDAAFWDASCSCYRSPTHRDPNRAGATTNCTAKTDNCTLPDDRATALAIVTGLAPAHRRRAAASSVLDLGGPHSSTFSSPPMEKFAIEALFLAGLPKAALRRMEARFGAMATCPGLTTLWEHWEADPLTGHPVDGYNHGWSGGGLVLLSQYVAGLEPTAPGWRTFRVAPRLGSLVHAAATVATVRGTVSVDVYAPSPSVLRVKVVVPRGAVGCVELSRGREAPRRLRVTGGAAGACNLVGPGQWTVEAEFSQHSL